MLSYELDGKGPPLVLIHGFGISFNIWRGLRPLLRDHFTLILTEMPGIGRSPVPDAAVAYLDAAVGELETLRAALGFECWSVLGYSSGSRVAERYVQCHPERVERAVFLSPAQTAAYKALGLRVAIRLDARYPQVGNWVLSGWRIRFLIDLLGLNFCHPDLLDPWFDEITSQPMDILKETLRSMPGGGGRPFAVPALPTLFVWGSQDLIADRPFRLSARDRLIRANHSAPQTDVAEIVEVVLPFLKS
ncbi:MAG: alpha/beta fold hydrolase [Chloroflexota bacterium]